MSTAAANALPVLDLRGFEAGRSERAAFLEQRRETARTLGFFYLAGHGIDAGLQRDVLALARRFFDLPEAEKLAIEMVKSPHFRGYTRAGWEHTRGLRDWREQLDVGTELPAVPVDPHAPAWTRLRGPNQWPEALPELRPVLLRYQAEAAELAIRLVRAFVAALGLAEDALESLYTPEPGQLIKIIRYPGRDETESEQGVGPHKDGGLVTVLLQDMQGGLEIETEDGWIGAPPVPGTFVVNIGELLELTANGYLRATVHRAVTPPTGTDRLSVAFFFLAQGSTRRCRCWHCRPSSPEKHGASPKIRSIRSSMRSAGIL